MFFTGAHPKRLPTPLAKPFSFNLERIFPLSILNLESKLKTLYLRCCGRAKALFPLGETQIGKKINLPPANVLRDGILQASIFECSLR